MGDLEYEAYEISDYRVLAPGREQTPQSRSHSNALVSAQRPFCVAGEVMRTLVGHLHYDQELGSREFIPDGRLNLPKGRCKVSVNAIVHAWITKNEALVSYDVDSHFSSAFFAAM